MPRQPVDRGLSAAIVCLGFISIVTQTILLREFLAVFAGNELVIGVVLANWMILTGAGALLGRLTERIGERSTMPAVLVLCAAVLPAITTFLLRFLRALVFPQGSLIGIVESAYTSFVLLVPYCLVSGFLFSLMAHLVSGNQQENRIAGVYSLEAIGSILGGVVFNLLAVFLLTTFQALILLALPGCSVSAVLSARTGHRVLTAGIMGVLALVLVVMVTVDLDGSTRRQMFKGQDLLYQKDTPYGNLTVTKQGEQTNFFENSALLFSTNDVTTNEEAVHYAMIQHPHPVTVLMISGGASGIAEEICKYGVNRIDYVEINPWILDAGKKYTNALENPRIHVINEDAKRYLRHCVQRYDVVLLNTPDPETAHINRYYTLEFFRELKSHLNGGAIVSLGLLSASDYYGASARVVSSSIANTLRNVFRNVLIVPGNRNFFLASDRELTINVARSIAARGVPTRYVNKDYVDDQLLGQRSGEITRSLDSTVGVNRDFSPVAYYRQMQYWLSYFAFEPWIPAAIAGVILLGAMFRLNAVSFGMLTGGFAASSVEIVLLVSFQMIFGYVYLATGIIITIFMAGLALGSWYGHEKLLRTEMKTYAGLQGLIGLYCMSLPPVLWLLRDTASDVVVYGAFALLILVMGLLVGKEFSMATGLLRGTMSAIASDLYGTDLLGSAIGALVVSVYLLPLLGVGVTCVVIGLASLLSASVSLIRGGRAAAGISEGVSYV